MSRLIPRVYEMVHHICMYRNSIVHKNVEEKLNRQAVDKLNSEIDRIYDLPIAVFCHTHRYLIDEGIHATKARKVRQKKYWVRTLQVSLEYQKQADENMYVGMRSLMLQWATFPD